MQAPVNTPLGKPRKKTREVEPLRVPEPRPAPAPAHPAQPKQPVKTPA
jgi:hypothetical protein